MINFLRLFFLFFLVFSNTNAVHAADKKAEPERYTNFRLLAEKPVINAGEELWVAVEQNIHPHWHSYWINPGDSGAAPNHVWSTPEGFQISEILWPAPKKIPYPPLLNYGYEGTTALLHKVTAPETLPDGPVKLRVDIDILVCKDICIPEFDTLEITLNDPSSMPWDHNAYFQLARAKLPSSVNEKAHYFVQNGNFVLDIPTSALSDKLHEENSLQFLPIDWGIVENAAEQNFEKTDTGWRVTQKIGERPLGTLEHIKALISYQNKNGEYNSISIMAEAQNSLFTKTNETDQIENNPTKSKLDSLPTSEKDKVAKTGLITAILFALFGGLVLNLMPCVFPVLSLKALSLSKISEKSPALARMHGLSYTAGVILSFLAIAGTLIALQASGSEIGWGFQLQNPFVVAILAYLLFIIGLNLAGYFEVSNSLGNTGQKLTQGDGLGSSFFTGVLATVVATPCTAPFMGVAIGYALLQPPIVALSIFASLGLGLALPYLVLAFIPALQKSLPRPGAWMDVFKQLLAFPMFAFSAWLVWIFSQQADSLSLLGLLIGMIAVAFGFWLTHVMPKSGLLRLLAIILMILTFVTPLVFTAFIAEKPNNISGTAKTKDHFYQDYSPSALENALQSSNPVFVEMTAAWCITCKVNHVTSININATKDLFAKNNVEFLVGDWTNYNSDITQYLNQFGRNGVPLYVFYGAPDKNGERPEPVVLPQILTPSIVVNIIRTE